MTFDPSPLQGVWGITAKESDVEFEKRRQFVDKNVSAFRSEFVVLQDSFKVNCVLLQRFQVCRTVPDLHIGIPVGNGSCYSNNCTCTNCWVQ